MVAAREYFAAEAGLRLCVDDAGGPGFPVLFQHGLCGDAAQTTEVFPQNSALRRITLEMRGHGASEAGDSEAFSIATFANDIAALIETKKLAPIIVGGISMGAAIAMRLAVLRPDLTSGLIIARPAWSTAVAPKNMYPNAEVGELLSRMPQKQALSNFMASATANRLAADAPDNLTSLTGLFSRDPQNVTAALLKAISVDGPGVTRIQLQSLAVPTLVIGHHMDSVHPFSLAQDIAGLIPNAELIEITPKAVDRARYVSGFQAALNNFLRELLP